MTSEAELPCAMEAILAPDVSEFWPIWVQRWRSTRPQHHIVHFCERWEALECTAPGERFQPRSVSLRGALCVHGNLIVSIRPRRCVVLS